MKANGLIIVLILSPVKAVYHYEFHFEDEDVFEPCSKYPDNFVDKKFDLSNLHFDSVGDGKVHVKGTLKSTVDFNNLMMRTDVYKHIRGTWQPTVFSLERKDFCRFIEDPNDMIYSFTQNLPELRCPFTEGKTYNLDYVADVGFTFFDKNLEGLYRVVVKMTNTKNIDDFACMSAEVYWYRK